MTDNIMLIGLYAMPKTFPIYYFFGEFLGFMDYGFLHLPTQFCNLLLLFEKTS